MTEAWTLLLSGLAFAGVFAAVVLGERVLAASQRVNRRLFSQTPAGGAAGQPLLRASSVDHPLLRGAQDLLAGDPRSETRLRRDLALAGFAQPGAPAIYLLVRAGLGVLAPLAALAGLAAAGVALASPIAAGVGVAVCAAGLAAPTVYVRRRAAARRRDMEHQFPDALDLLVVCVEAGLGLDSALVRVSEEVRESHPRIAQEFRRLSEEVVAGRSRPDALRDMAARIDVDMIRSFVALLIQTQSLGVSIGQSLRVFSSEMRTTRYLRAEEKAMRIPVLMSLPMVACFMPVIIVALLLPAAIDVVRTLLPSLARP